MDLITLTSRIPTPGSSLSSLSHVGETIIGTRFYTRCGGKGANQAVAVAKLCKDKQQMRFVSVIGKDANGDELQKKLSAYGVILDDVIVKEGISTGIASICIDDKGENSIIVVPGANNCFTEEVVSGDTFE